MPDHNSRKPDPKDIVLIELPGSWRAIDPISGRSLARPTKERAFGALLIALEFTREEIVAMGKDAKEKQTVGNYFDHTQEVESIITQGDSGK